MIWCDLDGVLVDIEGGYLQRFGHDMTLVDKKTKWSNVAGCPNFYQHLPWMPGGRELWRWIAPTGAHILTATAKSVPTCGQDKVDWCTAELGIGTDRVVVVYGRENKRLYCSPGDILLDDREDVLEQWMAAGGYGVLVKPGGHEDAARLALDLWRARQ